MTLVEIMKKVDALTEKYGSVSSEVSIRTKLRADLLDLVQDAVDHGAEKDQNKISGIIVKGIKAFMGGKD